MVLVPAAKQVGTVELIVGVAGVGSISELLKEAETPEIQPPLDAVIV